MPETWHVWMAIYAAIVATGALALEVRRWFEGQARLYVSATPGMSVYNVPSAAGRHFLVVNVTNRGGSPTTLQVLGLHNIQIAGAASYPGADPRNRWS